MMGIDDEFFSEIFIVEKLFTVHISLAFSIEKISDIFVVIPHETLVYQFYFG